MGSADLVPGVSGGTIAFISGIYEELLTAIKTVTGPTLKYALKLQFKKAFTSVPFRFVLPLGLGLVSALFSLAGLLTYLLEHHGPLVWAFFFGLVSASTYIVAKRVVRWNSINYVVFVGAAVCAYILVGGTATQLPHSPLMTFFSGAVAISAMILPGISGSFILVLLGQYTHILASVTNFDFVTLALFIMGTILGIALFARALSWLLKKHHDITIAILSGFMLGSLRKIWPFPELSLHGYINPKIWLLILAGAVIVVVLSKYHALKERT